MIRQIISVIFVFIGDLFHIAAQLLRESVKPKVHDIDGAWLVQATRRRDK